VVRNQGVLPGSLQGKRVRVRLFNGADSARFDPSHWDAGSLDWSIRTPSPHPFDIEFFEVIA
jgi:hypothetical protein